MVLDMDSTEIPVCGQQENSFELFLFAQITDLVA
jgi:hypothetical protein